MLREENYDSVITKFWKVIMDIKNITSSEKSCSKRDFVYLLEPRIFKLVWGWDSFFFSMMLGNIPHNYYSTNTMDAWDHHSLCVAVPSF